MTHKKYHRIRIICSGSVLALLLFLICRLIGFINAGGTMTLEKVIPVIIVAGILFLIFAIVFGRIFCGFLCPLGLFFDIVWQITERLHLPKLRRNEKFMRIINIFNKAFLVAFICGILSLIAILIFSPETLSGVRIPLFVLPIAITGMIVLNAFARRFFCNVCPIGSFIGLFKRFSIVKLEKESKECMMCGMCYEACPMRIKKIYTEMENKNVSGAHCIYCGECIKKCPSDNALSVTICGRKVYSSSEKDFTENQFSDIAINNNHER